MALTTISNSEEFNNIVSPQRTRLPKNFETGCRCPATQINNGRVVVIDFYANWDGCSGLWGQQLSDLSETFKRLGVDFYSVNVDEADDVVLEVDIRVVCKRNQTAALKIPKFAVVCRYLPLWFSKTETRLDVERALVRGISMSVNLCNSMGTR